MLSIPGQCLSCSLPVVLQLPCTYSNNRQSWICVDTSNDDSGRKCFQQSSIHRPSHVDHTQHPAIIYSVMDDLARRCRAGPSAL